uniref:Macro domain n=1 Tax=Nothobranchius pienaari TaxID=704102 RepID=A0A1A8L9F2_9TELE
MSKDTRVTERNLGMAAVSEYGSGDEERGDRMADTESLWARDDPARVRAIFSDYSKVCFEPPASLVNAININGTSETGVALAIKRRYPQSHDAIMAQNPPFTVGNVMVYRRSAFEAEDGVREILHIVIDPCAPGTPHDVQVEQLTNWYDSMRGASNTGHVATCLLGTGEFEYTIRASLEALKAVIRMDTDNIWTVVLTTESLFRAACQELDLKEQLLYRAASHIPSRLYPDPQPPPVYGEVAPARFEPVNKDYRDGISSSEESGSESGNGSENGSDDQASAWVTDISALEAQLKQGTYSSCLSSGLIMLEGDLGAKTLPVPEWVLSVLVKPGTNLCRVPALAPIRRLAGRKAVKSWGLYEPSGGTPVWLDPGDSAMKAIVVISNAVGSTPRSELKRWRIQTERAVQAAGL